MSASNDVIRILTSRSPESLQTLLVVRAMSDAYGNIPHDIAVIAETLGVTPVTLRKRLRELDGYVKVRAGRVTTTPIDGNALAAMLAKRDDDDVEPIMDGQAVIRRWGEKYAERYGVKYVWTTKRDTSIWFAIRGRANLFAAQYGENALAVIDAIIDNYDALWKTGDYPRPTFGQLSWIGEKAAPLAKMRQTCDTQNDEGGYDRLEGV